MAKMKKINLFLCFCGLISQIYGLTSFGKSDNTHQHDNDDGAIYIRTDKSGKSSSYYCNTNRNYFSDSGFFTEKYASFQEYNDKAEVLTISNCGRVDLNSLPTNSTWPNLRKVYFINIDSVLLHGQHWPSELYLKNVSAVQLAYPIPCRRLELNQIKLSIVDEKRYLQDLMLFSIVRDYRRLHDMEEFSIINSELPRLTPGSLTVIAEKVLIKDNIFNTVDSDGFEIKSYNIVIAGNYFMYLSDSALNDIIVDDRIIDNGTFNGTTSLVIENNTIEHLDPSSLDLRFPGSLYEFDSVTIRNNKINCNCKNIEWFHSLRFIVMNQNIPSDDHSIKRRLYYKQIIDNNYCLNNGKCKLGDVFTNYEKFCDSNYYLDDNCLTDASFSELKESKPITNDNSHLILINFDKYFYVTLCLLLLIIAMSCSFMGFYVFNKVRLYKFKRYIMSDSTELNEKMID